MALPAMIRRAGTALGLLTPDDNAAAIGPIREASPEQDDAEPPVDQMTSRSGEASFLPAFYLKSIATNDDPHLERDGSGLKLYDALLTDEAAFSTLQQRRLAITSRDWEVVAGDENDPASVKAADDFRAMIDALGFDRVTGLLHYAVWYGYGVGEALYSMREHDGRMIVWIDDIVVPDRRHFGFTHEGELRYVAGLANGLDGAPVPLNKFVTIRTGGTHDFAFYGLGLAHWCYWPIFFKRACLKFWSLYLEKRGNPTVAIEFQEADKDDKVKKAQLLGAAVAVGSDKAVLLPADTLKNERIKILESARTGAAGDFKDFLVEQNEAIMRVVLGQPGTSKGVSSGLNSDQASEHGEVKADLVKADSDLITDALQRTYGKWVTVWNHGEGVKPPMLRRILDDGEDLTVTATRDVALDGIGIRRTEDSIKATYGEGYEVDRVSAAEADANDRAIAAAKVGMPAPGGNVVDMAAARKAKIAAFAAQGGATAFAPLYVSRKLLNADELVAWAKIAAFAAQGGATAFAPLYVSRKLLNADELVAWAKKQGFAVTVPAADMHVTILYSKTAVDWFAMGDAWGSRDDDGTLTVAPGGARFVERFGPVGAEDTVVLRFLSPDLRWRHDSMIEAGASSDYDEFKPHISISYDGAGVDLATVEPFVGALRFGPEIFEPIKADPDPSDATGFLAFTADDEAAIERLSAKLVEEADPVFAAMAETMRGALQGVTTVEAARVALLDALEQLPTDRLARLTALPMLAERAGALAGVDELVDA